MKYSILLPYYDRLSQLETTLKSFVELYSDRKDFEIIIIEDRKQKPQMTVDLLGLLGDSDFIKLKWKYIKCSADISFSPATAFNDGAKESNGEFLIITNPECKHDVDILSELDKEFESDTESYIICACKSINKNGTFHRWYQHTKHRNRMYHFCSAISKEIYFKIGGFDERFTKGISYDDNAFIDNIIKSDIKVKVRDDLIVSHLWHKKNRPYGYRSLLARNKKLYTQIYKH